MTLPDLTDIFPLLTHQCPSGRGKVIASSDAARDRFDPIGFVLVINVDTKFGQKSVLFAKGCKMSSILRPPIPLLVHAIPSC